MPKRKKKSNLKNVLIILLFLVAICLVGYGIKYIFDNADSQDGVVDSGISSSHSDPTLVDGVEQPTPDVKVNLTTLPNTTDTITTLNYTDFKKLFKTSMRSILVLEKEGCEFCAAYEPVLKTALEELDLTAYKINITNLTSKENSDIFKYLNYDGTPTTYIIEQGKVIHTFSGYTDKSTIEAFLDVCYLR